MNTEPSAGGAPTPGDGINPAVHQEVDTQFSEDQHGSEPMETVSVKRRGPEMWPLIWAFVTVALVLITIWLVAP